MPGGSGGATGHLPSQLAPQDGCSRSKPSIVAGNPGATNSSTNHPHDSHAVESPLVLSCPCITKLSGRWNRSPRLATVLYATSAGVREALPVWLLAETRHGGLDSTTPLVGAVLTAGVLSAAAGRAVASAGWLGTSLAGDGRGVSAGERRLLSVVRTRFLAVAVLGLLYLLARLLPSFTHHSVVILLAATVVMTVNHVSLELCMSRPKRSRARGCSFGSVDGHEGARSRATSGASSVGGAVSRRSPPVTMMVSGSVLGADVLGSAAGPLLLALALCADWPSPFDSSWWLVGCLFGDFWLSSGSREAEPRHTRLLDCDDSGSLEGEHPSGRFAQFV